jgi:phenylalanyl-tRNA synthetase beta chain
MKVSYNWLREYVNADLSADALGELLTMAGLEVDGIQHVGDVPDGIVVGHVLEVAPHPRADRLTVCSVDVGARTLRIVCGAPNVAAGQKVPVALEGATVTVSDREGKPTSLTIKATELRGEPSEGMICAEDEIGLSDDHSGIMVLTDDAEIGIPLREHLTTTGAVVDDFVFDVAITPNRPDATSHIGVARDLAALTDTALQLPSVHRTGPASAGDDVVSIRIEDSDLCRRYVGLVVRGVRIGESPAWMQARLRSVGLRPRNNIVDITNYVMYECGQPLHAFDLDLLAGPGIVVRSRTAPGPFTTLDDRERSIPAGTLMICDLDREVAVAGVMGGQNSEVSEETRNVLIESAYFDPVSIRRTAKHLGLQTDASYRFERGVDPEGQLWAARRAADLMAELAGGTVVEEVDEHPRMSENRIVDLRPGRVEQILGTDIPGDRSARLLESIGFKVENVNGVLRCEVPSFRPDIEREIDVIEEVARLYGYDRIPEPDYMRVPNFTSRREPAESARRRTIRTLAALGFREVYTNSLLSEERATMLNARRLTGGADGSVVLTANAISGEMNALRPCLLASVLPVVGHNLNHGQASVRLAEIGHVYARVDEGGEYIPGYAEHESLALAHAGLARAARWDSPPRAADVFDMKGVVEAILSDLRVPNLKLTPASSDDGFADYHLSVTSDSTVLGSVGSFSRRLLNALDVKADVYFAELNWTAVLACAHRTREGRYEAIPRFPIVERDLAFVVDDGQDVGPMLNRTRAAGGPLLSDVDVFDLYRGDRMPPGKKSVAFALRFRSDRTLRDEEVDACVSAIVTAVESEFEAELRS